MFKKCVMAIAVLAISGGALLFTPSSAWAQRRGGGRGGNWNSRDYRGGDFRGDDFRRRGGWGWGVGIGFPYYGWYGNGYRPYYGDSYAPSYYYSEPAPYYAGDNVTYSSSAYPPQADDRAHVSLRVPSNHAEVWIEGEHSIQDRAAENYASPPLTPGQKYYYEIRARWTDANGRTMDQTRTFPIYAGSSVAVDFGRPAPADQTVTSSSDR